MEFRFPICGSRPKVPTEEEEEILSKLRALKHQIRGLKESLKSASDEGEVKRLTQELEVLRVTWNTLQAEKEKARENRMRLLGYND